MTIAARSAALFLAAAFALSGCGGDDDGAGAAVTETAPEVTVTEGAGGGAGAGAGTDTGTDAGTGEEGAETTGEAEGPVAGEKDRMPSLSGDVSGIRDDVDLEDCTREAGDVVARGSVTNSADEARDVVVAVIWVAQDSGSSEGLKVFTVPNMAAGATEEFELTTTLANEARRCVLNARSAPVGSLDG
ncbi:MAG: hypothetical protein Q4G67_10510 [Actinomycetia bacterium]|nr:hypothetical protein [Actinomycetes bacterium]